VLRARTKVKLQWPIAAAIFCGLGGCYRHVVRAEGASPGEFTIHEPNLKEDEAKPTEKSPFDRKLPSKESKESKP
jgi:hypothetical protein